MPHKGIQGSIPTHSATLPFSNSLQGVFYFPYG